MVAGAWGSLPPRRPDQPARGRRPPLLPPPTGNVFTRLVVGGGPPPAGGLFIYNGPAAPGSLIAAGVSTGGTDLDGNAVIQGLGSYSATIAAILAGAGLNFYLAGSEAGPWSQQAAVGIDSAGDLQLLGGLFSGENSGMQISQTGNQVAVISADLDVISAGFGLKVKRGTNCKAGINTLAPGGAVTVNNSTVTAASGFLVTAVDNNSTGAMRVSARVVGTSFTITSSNAADTGNVFWLMMEPG